MSHSGAKYRPDMQVVILPAYPEAALDEKQPETSLTASEKAFVAPSDRLPDGDSFFPAECRGDKGALSLIVKMDSTVYPAFVISN